MRRHTFAEVIVWSDFSAAPGGPLVHAVNPDKVQLAMCGYPLDPMAAFADSWDPMRPDACWACARAVNQIIEELAPPTNRGWSGPH